MKTRNIYFLGILLLLFTVSCEKEVDNGQAEDYHGFPHGINAMFSYSQYKTGSYWVFADSVTNQTDSVYLYENESVWLHNYDHYNHHVMRTISYPSYDTLTFAIGYHGLAKGFDGTLNSGTLISKGFHPGIDSAPNYIPTLLDSFFVYDRFYRDVVMAEVEIDSTEGNYKSVYYTNTEFGFLRHDVYSGSTLILKKVLVNKNIVR